MPGLLLHEQQVPAALDQVRHIRSAQRVEIQPRIQAERVPVACAFAGQACERAAATKVGKVAPGRTRRRGKPLALSGAGTR
jgi:hypothetical protein